MSEHDFIPAVQRWYLGARKVHAVRSTSGQSEFWTLKIRWSQKLGLYVVLGEGDYSRRAKHYAQAIVQRGWIRPDLWKMDFYPGKRFLEGYHD